MTMITNSSSVPLALLRRARASERALRLVSGALVAVGVVVAILRAAGV
jgi:hypothetical protein